MQPVAAAAEKPEKFNGQNFKTWQQKTFYLTMLNLVDWLMEDASVRHALTAKKLWEMLKKKYITGVAGAKKFIIERLLDFKMVDEKSGDFKIYLKHKWKEMDMARLINRLQTEEEHRSNLASRGHLMLGTKANKVKHKGQSSRFKTSPRNNELSGKNWKPADKEKEKLKPSGGVEKEKSSFKGTCFNFGKLGHRSFSSFMRIKGEMMYMGNAAPAKVKGRENVLMKITSGRVLMLTNVLSVCG
ncbi:uncharacterized protein LOC127245004 [Andrographis paniculata]|uniref:uncharacterized protein LOC127245004 n=1 Tax=Andrographis paniculata TaxID=175694 RepID=UPI0021E740A2|nr:uncharacterized protein LOC127245004 [Andrographis paniculata]